MLCFVFITALVLPSLALEGKGEKGNTTVCSDPAAIKAGDEFFKCFDVYVKNSLRQENKTCNPSLGATIFGYVKVANKTCYNDTISFDRDSLEFYKLMMFSLRNGNLKEFAENGGLECIRAIKPKINRCVTDVIGHVKGAHNRYHTLWKKSGLRIDIKSCKETYMIKQCTLNEMRTEGYYKCKYENSIVVYVSTLFDYMLERCTRLKPTWADNLLASLPKARPENKLKDDVRTTHILLGLLLTLAVMGIMYTILRDCRTPSGRWKTFNEQFSMRQRSRSLVNNEAFTHVH